MTTGAITADPGLDEEQQEPSFADITTGSAEIDRKLGGGIAPGSLTLIEGQADSGKSVLAQQLIWGSLASNNYQVILFTTETAVRGLHKSMDALGMDILDYVLLGNLKVFSAAPAQMGSDAAFEAIFTLADRFPEHSVIIVDSLTGVIAHASERSVISYFEGCKVLCDHGRTVVNVAHTYAFTEDSLARLRSVCDAHLRLRREEMGDRLVKVLEVAKVRGADKTNANMVSFEVEPGVGMRVMPLSRAKA